MLVQIDVAKPSRLHTPTSPDGMRAVIAASLA
jgi:hypothetical protein